MLIFPQVSEVLSDNAKIQKGATGMKLQRCFAVKVYIFI